MNYVFFSLLHCFSPQKEPKAPVINEQFAATISSITVTWSPAAESLQVC